MAKDKLGKRMKENYEKEGATRSRWVVEAPPIFTQDKSYLINLIPEMEGIAND